MATCLGLEFPYHLSQIVRVIQHHMLRYQLVYNILVEFSHLWKEERIEVSWQSLPWLGTLQLLRAVCIMSILEYYTDFLALSTDDIVVVFVVIHNFLECVLPVPDTLD